jgi:hypothetical protein
MLRKKVVHHTAHDHVDEGIDPEGCDQNENEPDRIHRTVGRLVDGNDAEDKGEKLPYSAHCDYPCVGLFIVYCLAKMHACCETE